MERKFREAYYKNYVDVQKFRHDRDEVTKLFRDEAEMNELRRRGEWAAQMRYIYDKIPDLHLFSRQEVEFLDAEQRTDHLRMEAGKCLAAAREKSAPLPLEIDLTKREYGARSIEVRPARHHKRLHGGEDIIFRLRSPLEGYLSVFNLGTSGDTLLTHPTTGSGRANRACIFSDIPDNTEYEFGRMKGTPYGVEVVQAFVTPAHISSYIRVEIPQKSFCRWTGHQATTILCDLAAGLAKLHAGSWAMGEMSFEVVPA